MIGVTLKADVFSMCTPPVAGGAGDTGEPMIYQLRIAMTSALHDDTH